MKKFTALLFTVLFSTAFTCKMVIRSEKYDLKNGKVYFNSYVNEALESEKQLKNVDIKSFKILNENDIAYDKNSIYLFGIPKNGKNTKDSIYNADKETLQVIFSRVVSYQPHIAYYKDKNNVYYNYIKIPDADPKTFTLLNDFAYSKDKNFVYYNGVKMQNTDAQSFAALESGYFKDKNFIYYKGKALENSDSNKEFKTAFIEKIHTSCDYDFDLYISNNGNTYNFGELTANAKYDPASFTAYDNGYSKDKNSVYYFGEKIEGWDPASFKYFNYAYISDKNGVYYNNKKIPEADPKTFELLKFENENDNRYGRDKNSVYFNGKKTDVSDPKSFEIISFSYSKDKKNVYYDGIIVIGADPATFGEAWSKSKGYTGYFMDKKNVYLDGYLLKGENVKDYEYRFKK